MTMNAKDSSFNSRIWAQSEKMHRQLEKMIYDIEVKLNDKNHSFNDCQEFEMIEVQCRMIEALKHVEMFEEYFADVDLRNYPGDTLGWTKERGACFNHIIDYYYVQYKSTSKDHYGSNEYLERYKKYRIKYR